MADDAAELAFEASDKLIDKGFDRLPGKMFGDTKPKSKSKSKYEPQSQQRQSNHQQRRNSSPGQGNYSDNEDDYYRNNRYSQDRYRPTSPQDTANSHAHLRGGGGYYSPPPSASREQDYYRDSPRNDPYSNQRHGQFSPSPYSPNRPSGPDRRASSSSPPRHRNSRRDQSSRLSESPSPDRRHRRRNRDSEQRSSRGGNGLTAGALGAVAGGILGQEVSKKNPVFGALAGVVVGALGATIVDRRT